MAEISSIRNIEAMWMLGIGMYREVAREETIRKEDNKSELHINMAKPEDKCTICYYA